jgi:hypothetical protein
VREAEASIGGVEPHRPTFANGDPAPPLGRLTQAACERIVDETEAMPLPPELEPFREGLIGAAWI